MAVPTCGVIPKQEQQVKRKRRKRNFYPSRKKCHPEVQQWTPIFQQQYKVKTWFKSFAKEDVIYYLNQNENYTSKISFHFTDIGDKLIEVVGLENCLHMGQVRTGLRSSGKRLAQCSSLIIKTKKKFPMQVDGEPWCQVPCTVYLN